MFLNTAYDGAVQMQFRSGVQFSGRLLFHLFCCSELTISFLDHTAGNLELQPKPAAGWTRRNKHREFHWKVKMQLESSAHKCTGCFPRADEKHACPTSGFLEILGI